MFPVTTMVAQLHAKRSLMISVRMSAQAFNKITNLTKQPSELLSSMEELKKAIGSLTGIPSIPGTISGGLYQNSCHLEDQTPWRETRKPSVEVPQMTVQPSKVKDGVQACATTSESSDSTNQVLATAAFIAGLAVGAQIPSELVRTQRASSRWDGLSIRSVD